MIQSTTNKVLAQIEKTPNRTQKELAALLYGPSSYPQQITTELDALLKLGLVDRSGCGGRYDPYTYHRIKKAS